MTSKHLPPAAGSQSLVEMHIYHLGSPTMSLSFRCENGRYILDRNKQHEADCVMLSCTVHGLLTGLLSYVPSQGRSRPSS